MLDIKTKEVVKTFPSVIKAAQHVNLHVSSVANACRDVKKTSGGYIFEYA
jgi:hypothetical protein